MSPRVDSLPEHFDRVHFGRFLATARLQVCSRCGSSNSCNCTIEKPEMETKKMERRVRHELGLNSATRRYDMAQPFTKVWCLRIFFWCIDFQHDLHWRTRKKPGHHKSHHCCQHWHCQHQHRSLKSPSWCIVHFQWTEHQAKWKIKPDIMLYWLQLFVKVIVLSVYPSLHLTIPW